MDRARETPLMAAASMQQVKRVAFLLSDGVSPDIKDVISQSALVDPIPSRWSSTISQLASVTMKDLSVAWRSLAMFHTGLRSFEKGFIGPQCCKNGDQLCNWIFGFFSSLVCRIELIFFPLLLHFSPDSVWYPYIKFTTTLFFGPIMGKSEK